MIRMLFKHLRTVFWKLYVGAKQISKMLNNFIGMYITNLFRLVARQLKRTSHIMAIATVVAVAILAGHTASAQVGPPPNPLASLKTVAVPEPPNLGQFVKNKPAAIALGKALFWDMQVGSDGIMSCASCHLHQGAATARQST